MDVTVTCPYCNAPEKNIFHETPIPVDKGVITKCCNRLVVTYLNMETNQTLMFRPNTKHCWAHGTSGDTSDVLCARWDSQRPQSKFTWIFQDGFTHVVRLVPKFMDLEKAGRAWGIGLGQRFTSQIEAHRFADSVDKFLLQMIKEFNAIPERDSKGRFAPKFPPQGD